MLEQGNLTSISRGSCYKVRTSWGERYRSNSNESTFPRWSPHNPGESLSPPLSSSLLAHVIPLILLLLMVSWGWSSHKCLSPEPRILSDKIYFVSTYFLGRRKGQRENQLFLLLFREKLRLEVLCPDPHILPDSRDPAVAFWQSRRNGPEWQLLVTPFGNVQDPPGVPQEYCPLLGSLGAFWSWARPQAWEAKKGGIVLSE